MTGSPLKDCMKVLNETNGDLEKAKELLRKRGLADAEKRTGRATSEGYVGMKFDGTKRLLTMVELTCETDFVAKTDKFMQGLETVLDTFHAQGNGLQVNHTQMSDGDLISKLCKDLKLVRSLDADMPQQTIEDGIKYVISKTQENCRVNKLYQRSWNPEVGESMYSYIHNPLRSSTNMVYGKIGSLTLLKASDKAHNSQVQELATQLALHVAAMKPNYLRATDVPQAVVDKMVSELPENCHPGKKKGAIEKLMGREAFLEQELATSDEPLKIKDLLKQKEQELKTKLEIKEWALFNIGA